MKDETTIATARSRTPKRKSVDETLENTIKRITEKKYIRHEQGMTTGRFDYGEYSLTAPAI